MVIGWFAEQNHEDERDEQEEGIGFHPGKTEEGTDEKTEAFHILKIANGDLFEIAFD